MEELAERLGMSPRNFERRFKAATCQRPRACPQTLRIMAKHMLEGGCRSVQQVATSVGYDDRPRRTEPALDQFPSEAGPRA